MSTIIIISRPPPPPPGGLRVESDGSETGASWRERYAAYCAALSALNAGFATGATITTETQAPVDP